MRRRRQKKLAGCLLHDLSLPPLPPAPRPLSLKFTGERTFHPAAAAQRSRANFGLKLVTKASRKDLAMDVWKLFWTKIVRSRHLAKHQLSFCNRNRERSWVLLLCHFQPNTVLFRDSVPPAGTRTPFSFTGDRETILLLRLSLGPLRSLEGG